jgi:hypothetical protein
MQIEGDLAIKAPREEVFRGMLDPECLAKAVPGCEKLTLQGDNEYVMTLKIGVAAIKGTYYGKVQIEDVVPPEAYRMTVEGSSAPGVVKGTGHIRLSEDGNDTRVFYSGDVQVSGKIASVGNRFLGMIAKMLIGKFFDAMAKQIQERQAGRRAP